MENDIHIDIAISIRNQHGHRRHETQILSATFSRGSIGDGRYFHFDDVGVEQLPGSLTNGTDDLTNLTGGHQGFDSPVTPDIEDEIIDLENNRLESSMNGEDDCGGTCRICHLDFVEDVDNDEDAGLTINLGCKCLGDLGIAHKHCAVTWFRLRGNIICEICGVPARNVCIEQEAVNPCATEASSETTATVNLMENVSSNCGCFWSWLLAFMLIAIVLISIHFQGGQNPSEPPCSSQ